MGHFKIVVLDLEATCWQKDDPNHDEHKISEIIEIGAVKLDLVEAKIVGHFETLVKPVKNPILSEFCTELTGIKQEDLKGKPQFPEAYAHFKSFAGSSHKTTLAGWGAYDARELEKNCDAWELEYKRYEYWNVKNMFAAKYGERVGLDRAISQLGLTFEGQHHRALPDALNTARILTKLFHSDAEV